MSTNQVTVELHGVFFDAPLWDDAMAHAMRDATMDVADEGVRDVRVTLSQVLKHPTGLYESTIRAREQPFSSAMVDGMGTVYAWWLEGLGSRNAPVTRFPGYWTMKRTTPLLAAKAVELVQPALDRFIDEVSS
jgi:hypothetical protein